MMNTLLYDVKILIFRYLHYDKMVDVHSELHIKTEKVHYATLNYGDYRLIRCERCLSWKPIWFFECDDVNTCYDCAVNSEIKKRILDIV